MVKLPVLLKYNSKFSKGRLSLASLALAVAVACAAIFALGGCEADPDPCFKKEISRKASPDGQLTAILRTRDCGKHAMPESQVIIIMSGQKGPGFGMVFQADHTEGLELNWLGERVLEIGYQKARIFRFTNIWRWEPQDKKLFVVEVRLRQLSQGPALTPKAKGEGEGQGR